MLGLGWRNWGGFSEPPSLMGRGQLQICEMDRGEKGFGFYPPGPIFATPTHDLGREHPYAATTSDCGLFQAAFLKMTYKKYMKKNSGDQL
jgi:hypothetical protein